MSKARSRGKKGRWRMQWLKSERCDLHAIAWRIRRMWRDGQETSYDPTKGDPSSYRVSYWDLMERVLQKNMEMRTYFVNAYPSGFYRVFESRAEADLMGNERRLENRAIEARVQIVNESEPK